MTPYEKLLKVWDLAVKTGRLYCSPDMQETASRLPGSIAVHVLDYLEPGTLLAVETPELPTLDVVFAPTEFRAVDSWLLRSQQQLPIIKQPASILLKPEPTPFLSYQTLHTVDFYANHVSGRTVLVLAACITAVRRLRWLDAAAYQALFVRE